ncbi:MAG: TetR family transcriptional regulator [Acidimicrobiia bacterium]
MPKPEARPTRGEKKALTRRRLIDAAATVFAQRGFAAASLDEIAEEAGLTKGAVYSNFWNKEDLVSAVLEDRFDQRLRDVTAEVDFDAGLEEQARTSSVAFMTRSHEEEWLLLLDLEYLVHAIRNPEFRARHEVRHREALEAMTDVIESTAERSETALPMPAEQFAIVANALALGLSIESMQNPDGVPDELFGAALALMFRGAESHPSPGAAPS